MSRNNTYFACKCNSDFDHFSPKEGSTGDQHDHGHDVGGHDGDGGGDALKFPRLAHLVVIDRVAIILREYVRR